MFYVKQNKKYITGRCFDKMAKKVHSYSLKGDYTHDTMIVAEYDKKSETTTYYSLKDILSQFDNKSFSITIKEEDKVQSVEQPEEDGE